MIVPTLGEGGMEVLIMRMVRAFAAAGHDVGVTCTETPGLRGDALKHEGHRVTLVPTLGRATLLRPAALERWLRTLAPDVAHIHNGVWLKGARAARGAGVPCIVHTCHGFEAHEPWINAVLMRIAAWHTDRVVPVSEATAQRLRTQVHVPAARMRVIMNGIDISRFRPQPPGGAIRQGFGVDAGLIVGHVARLVAVKDQALLVDAFAALLRRLPATRLAIVGDGPLRGAIERRIAELGIGHAVRLFGTLASMEQVYQDFDVFALSSLDEGTSISVLEAMASGVCVVATSVGGTPGLLDGGRAGLLVPPGNANALASALADVLEAPALRAALGAAGRARALEHYSESSMMQEYQDLFYEVLGERALTEDVLQAGAAACAE